MGITADIPNDKPTFDGKTYGGNDNSSAKPYAEQLYNQIWTTNLLENSNNKNQTENFGSDTQCQNKALANFAQGYNIAPQINEGKMIEWVDENKSSITNSPWGPIKITGNPQTQQGGIWQQGNNPNPTEPLTFGYRNNPRIKMDGQFTIPYHNFNYYQNGTLPGSIIPSMGK